MCNWTTALRVTVAAGILGAALAAPGTAQAAGNPYTPQRVCGSGFAVIDHHAIPGAVVYLTYGGGSNCVTTIKTTAIGRSTPTRATLVVRGGGGGDDLGSYRYYAGPVKAAARGKCVRWGGATAGGSYLSPWEHCG